jgi:glutathione synthase
VVSADAHHALAREIKAFAAEHGKIVLKPLDGMGGKSIFIVPPGDLNMNVIMETLTRTSPASS